MKEKVIKLLESAKWRDEEITLQNFEVAHHVNAILIDIIDRINILKDENSNGN